MEFIVSTVSDCVYFCAVIYTGSRKRKAARTKFKLKKKRLRGTRFRILSPHENSLRSKRFRWGLSAR